MADQSDSHDVRELFESGARRYDKRQYGSGQRTFITERQDLVERLLAEQGLSKGARVLDVACGPGHMISMTEQAGYAAFGIDQSHAMLGLATTRVRAPKLAQADATHLPFASGSFDLVNSSGLIEYLSDPVSMMREAWRVVKPGGTVMISSTNRLSPALVLEPVVNAVRGLPAARSAVKRVFRGFDEGSVTQRRFHLTFHSPGTLRSLMAKAGFNSTEIRFFHFQLVPHPLEHVVPWLARGCAAVCAPLSEVRGLKNFAEGLIVIGRRPGA